MSKVIKKTTFVYCENSDSETIEKALESGFKVRALSKFDGQIEPGNIEKVIIVGVDRRGCAQRYEAAKIKVELAKGSKVKKIELPDEPKDPAVQTAGSVGEVEQLIEQGKELGLKLTRSMKPETMVAKIQEATDALDKDDENEDNE